MGIHKRVTYTADQTAPAVSAVAVTPDDDTDLAEGPTRALWVGAAGDVSVIMGADSEAVLFENVPDGTLLPFSVRRVLDTDTTATAIVAIR